MPRVVDGLLMFSCLVTLLSIAAVTISGASQYDSERWTQLRDRNLPLIAAAVEIATTRLEAMTTLLEKPRDAGEMAKLRETIAAIREESKKRADDCVHRIDELAYDLLRQCTE